MSMSGYTKLFNSILASTVWRSSDKTRIVWITMLAMADKDGICDGSVPGLADLSRVSLEDCEIALAELSGPDRYSRTSEHEGRRIEAIDGVGWRLLNHAKYRAKMSEDERREYNRKKQAEWRASQSTSRQQMSNNVNDSQSLSAMSAQAEADTEAVKEKIVSRKRATRLQDDWTLPDDWKTEAERLLNGRRLDLVNEAAKFKDYWIAQPGSKATKTDWLATWRNWIRNSRGDSNGAGTSKTRKLSLSDEMEAGLKRYADREDRERAASKQ